MVTPKERLICAEKIKRRIDQQKPEKTADRAPLKRKERIKVAGKIRIIFKASDQVSRLNAGLHVLILTN
jgi:hypothetical protein